MRRLIWVILGLLAVLAAAGYGLHFVPADFGYELEADFTDLPRDDGALEGWLRNQPGIYYAWIERNPIGGQWGRVVSFGTPRDSGGRPPLPDLESKCAELGYQGQKGRFRDNVPH